MRILKKAVTLIDIAKACDTSNVTVSKALAGKSGVSDALREKIKQVADEMGYVGVKSTQNRGGNTIGVLIPSKFINPNGSFYWALYNAIVTRLKKENMFCIMENLDQEDEDRLCSRIVSRTSRFQHLFHWDSFQRIMQSFLMTM